MEANGLIRIEPTKPAELFVPEVIAELITKVVAITDKHISDVTTEAGRKATKSLAYQVATAKTTVDNIGKQYVAELKAMPKEVDALRKKFRDIMDSIRDEVRRPVTEWEAAENEKARLEALAARKDADEIEAYAEQDLRERERKVAEQEAEIARQAEEKRQAEEAERLAREQKEREERIAREAAEKAERDAAEAVRVAEEKAVQAEKDKMAAEAKAKADQEAAVKAAELKAQQEAERKEANRLATEQAEKAKAEKAANNKRHRARIEREATESISNLLADLRTRDTAKDEAELLVSWIIDDRIAHITINY